MNFKPDLVRGTLIRRYKRFLSDVRLDDGREITAHCPNPGSMLSLLTESANGVPQQCWLTPHDDPKRKLQWTLELLDVDGVPVCVNTQRPNSIAAEAVANGFFPELAGYRSLRREVKYGRNSRIDLLLEDPDRPPCYIEVKGVTLSRTPGIAEFPDSVTRRGAKHLDELADMVRDGARAVMLYLSPRPDGRTFRLADDIDPAYSEAFNAAVSAGVEVLACACTVSAKTIYPSERLRIDVGHV